MTGTFLPILLAVGGVIAGLMAYRNVQRGGARFYQLERDALLRRASFLQLTALVLLVSSVGLLVYWQSQQAANLEDIENSGVDSAEITPSASAPPTESVVVNSQPPTLQIILTPTKDPAAPTPVPTSIVRRAEVKNTGGSGVYLREGASTLTDDLEQLDEGTLLTLLDDEEPIEAEGFTWVHVRTLGGTEGYVVDIYLEEFKR
ncbi:MAG TPA: SH3 domain-containing protein [Anaerolineae bacterium]|nr:SH3 domain-containing protein [Anaerolineae bacterium]